MQLMRIIIIGTTISGYIFKIRLKFLSMASYWDHLPEHLQYHIRSFIPLTCMPPEIQIDIKTQSAIFKINKMANLWSDAHNVDDREDVRMTRWTEFYLGTFLDGDKLTDNLMECGCCVRHSGFKRPTKLGECFRNVISENCSGECTCACRHWIRLFSTRRYQPKLR